MGECGLWKEMASGFVLWLSENLGCNPKKSLWYLGTGTTLDQLFTGTAELTYNIPHWKFGAEYSLCNAWYGDEFDAESKSNKLSFYTQSSYSAGSSVSVLKKEREFLYKTS